ncbi:hypothetical protein DKX38_009961 [Salix brachista]|uniref:Uncharacterized protein n=1 Tax=Salix brachista TaxID=2182728 RepID=A0A5N5MBV1_9ROSI|nr:hypothetical protein DKX38_009961 [Salix brachista]
MHRSPDEGGEALELAKGDFILVRFLVCLATMVLVEVDVQLPLTNDEPAIKLEALHYFLGLMVSLLCEHSCFSGAAASSARSTRNLD